LTGCYWAKTALGPDAQRRLAHARGIGSAHMHSAGAQPTATRARPVLAGPASDSAALDGAAHAGAVTAPGRMSRRGRRHRHSGGDGTNGGGRAPTTVRLPDGHGGRNASSSGLLVDGEKKSSSAVVFLRRGGATVAGGGPVTVRREGRVSSTLHGRRTTRGELGRRSPWSCSRRRRRPDSDGRGARTATVGFGLGDGAVRMSEARRLGERRARGRCRGGAGEASCRDAWRAVPTAALNRGVSAARGGHAATARWRGAWRLTGGACCQQFPN
jgi:hypothetical protein